MKYEINHIYNEDCIKVMHEMLNEKLYADCIITDPPYLINYKTNRRSDKTHKFTTPILNDDNPDLIKEYFKLCYFILKDNKALYSFCDIDKLEYFKQCLIEAGFVIRNIIIWSKGGSGMGDLENAFSQDYEVCILANKGTAKIIGKRYGSVWYFPKISQDKLLHQNQKPIDIIYRMLRAHTKENDLVFDGFAGSGTTAIACYKLNRNYLCCELDKYYFDVNQKRIKDETSQISFFKKGEIL